MNFDPIAHARRRWTTGEFPKERCFLLNFGGRYVREKFEKAARGRGGFTDVFPVDLVPRIGTGSELCLLSFDGMTISFAGIARPSVEVATGQRRVAFEQLQGTAPLDISELAGRSNQEATLNNHLTSEGFGQPLESGEWVQLVLAIFDMNPKLGHHLTFLTDLLHSNYKRLPPELRVLKTLQADALGTALDLFGKERASILTSEVVTSDPFEPYPSFLTSVAPRYLVEKEVLFNDIQFFPGWCKIENGLPVGVVGARFAQGDRRLTVLEVNATELEADLGVDMIYINESMNAGIYIQYKMFRPEGIREELTWRPDARALDQAQRMAAWFRESGVAEIPRHPQLWRLNANPGYFKLCDPILREAKSPDLAEGIYIPIEMLDVYLQSGLFDGPMGGKRFRSEENGLGMSNSLFATLVQKGLIGSTGRGTEALKTAISEAIFGRRRTTILAHET